MSKVMQKNALHTGDNKYLLNQWVHAHVNKWDSKMMKARMQIQVTWFLMQDSLFPAYDYPAPPPPLPPARLLATKFHPRKVSEFYFSVFVKITRISWVIE